MDQDVVLPRLWGWSWRGWVALAVLGAMLVAMARGVDLRFQLQKMIMPLGWGVQSWFAGRFLSDQYWIAWGAGFGLISLCWMLAALHSGPVRWRGWAYAGLAAWAVAGPMVRFTLFSAMTSPGAWLARLVPNGSWPNGAFAISCAITHVPAVGLVWAATRSWRLAAALLLASIVLIVPTGHFSFTKFSNEQSMLVAAGTNLVLAAIAFGWAIAARRRAWPAHVCRGCGYDLRGIRADVCPECGGTISPESIAPPSQRV